MEKIFTKLIATNRTSLQPATSLLTISWWSAILIWLLISLGWRPLKSPDEARYVTVAWEMLKSGHLWLPTINELPFFHKPPFFYWLTDLSLYACGLNNFCIRLVPLSAAFVTCLAIFFFIREYVSAMLAHKTVLILVTLPFFYFAAQFSNPDMLVSTFTTLTILATVHAIFRLESHLPYKNILMMAYAMAGLGMLAKGLIGIVLPAIVIFCWMLASGRGKLIARLILPRGLIILSLICLPWICMVEFHYPGFIKYFFIHHHFERYTESTFNNKQPFWFFLILLPLLTLPWSLGLLRGYRQMMTEMAPRQKEILRLMLIWVASIVLFFSLPSSKPPGYIIPVLPAFATLIAMVISPQSATQQFSKRLQIMLFIAAIGCLSAIKMTQIHDHKKTSSMLTSYLKKQVNQEDKVILLGKYIYDLRSSLDLNHPLGVVDDWHAADIDRHDNWRRELHEASHFAHVDTSEILIVPSKLDQTICIQSAPRIWVVGDQWHDQSIILSKIKPIYSLEGLPVWRIDSKQKSMSCQTEHIIEQQLLLASKSMRTLTDPNFDY